MKCYPDESITFTYSWEGCKFFSSPPQLWVNSRSDWVLYPWMATGLLQKKKSASSVMYQKLYDHLSMYCTWNMTDCNLIINLYFLL